MGQLVKQTHSKLNCKRKIPEYIRREWVDDYLLVRRAHRGKTDAWNTLYNKSYHRVKRYVKKLCYSLNLDSTVAEDVVNEAYYRCYYKLDEYRGFSMFSTWVCGFTRFIIYEHCRKEINYKQISTAIRLCAYYSLSSNPIDIVIADERECCVKVAFNALSYNQQKLLWLNIIDNITAEQISVRYSCCRETVEREIEKAKHLLKKRFSQLYSGGYAI